MKMIKRMMAFVLALVLVAGMVPHFAVVADAASTTARTVTLQLDEGYCPTHKEKGAKEVKSIVINNMEFGYADNGQQQVIIHFSYTVNCDTCGKDVTVSDWVSDRNSYLCTVGWNNKPLKSRNSDNKKVTVQVSRPGTHFVDSWTSDGTYHSGSCGFCGNVKDKCFGKHPTCVSRGLCSTCGNEYGSIRTGSSDHKWGEWKSNGDYKYHSRTCTLSADHTESGTCYGGTASCGSYAVCQLCGGDYGEKLSHSLNYTLVDGATNVLRESCSNCSHELEAVLTADDSTYTGSAITSASIFYPEGWVGTQVQPDADDYADNVNAGTATVTTTVEGMELTTTFAISKADIGSAAVAFNPEDPAYTGNAFSPEVIVSYNGTELTEGTHYSMRWHDDNLIDANSYAVEITGMGNFTGTKIDYFIIEKANPAVTAPTPRELFYTGAEQELLEKGSAEGGTMYYSLGTEDGPGENSLEDIPTGKDAGTYYVWYQVMGDENHNNTNYERVEVTIRKAKPTVSLPKANTLTYDGTAQELITAGSVAEGQGTMQYALISIGADGEPDASDPVYSTEIPTAVDAGVYFVSTQVEGTDNYASVGYPLIVVTIDEAEAGSFPPPYNANDLTYNGTDHVLALVSATIPYPGHFEFALSDNDSEAPESGWSETIPTGKDAGTYIVWWKFVADKNYKDTEPAVFLKTIAPKSIESGEADIECPSLTWNGAEQDAALSKFTLDGLEVTYELSGNTALHVGLHDMTITGTGNFTGQRDFSFLIVPDGTLLDGLENATVTSNDSETLRKAKDMVDNADTENLTDEMKQTLTDIGTKADALRKRLNDAVDASATENVVKGVAITGNNAKVSDKKTLTDARDDLEDALDTYSTNYTAEERKIITDEIDRLEDLIADISKAEDAVEAIEALPEKAEPDDGKTAAKIEAAQKLYDGLTDDQKKIADNSTEGKLPALQDQLRTIKVVKISATKWYKDSKKTITITYNGPYADFLRLEVNGKTLDKKHYTAKEGSTVITLKESYLQTLASRNSYNVVAVYEIDGEEIDSEKATFSVYKSTTSAATGDQFNVGLWAGIGGVSIIALIALLVIMKKKMK